MSPRQHLIIAYPDLSNLFQKVPPLEVLRPQQLPIAEAITKIVIGQMLSRVAADVIYSRLIKIRDRHRLEGSWKLSEKELLDCGVSRRKVRTIREFAVCYESDPSRFDVWPNLDHLDLRAAVSDYWGLSQWSADMLAIFYFGMPDVFPEKDGSIIRVQKMLEEHYLTKPLDPGLARPFRTTLARYMWALLDEGELSSTTSRKI